MVRGAQCRALSAAALALLGLCALVRADGLQIPQIEDRTITAGGYRLHYLEAGRGSPVVLLHGLGADSRVWRQVLPDLAANYHVYALDLPGFGQSEKPEIAYRVGTLADSASAFIDAAKINAPVVVGHSLGGWAAALLAMRHPDRLGKLVLVDAAGYGDEPGQLIRDYLSQYDPATAVLAERMLAGMTPEQQRAAQALVASYLAGRTQRPDGYAMGSLAQSLMRGDRKSTRLNSSHRT